jgi:hypothetical protein
MSTAVRHTFHTASDPSGESAESLFRGHGDASAEIVRPQPIMISTSDTLHAFDLFQPEPRTRAAEEPEPEILPAREPQSTAIVPISDGQFSRQVARALDAPVERPPLSLPLGGVAPTEREIASARALMIGWIAAIGIAAFAFLAQGPSLTPRTTVAEPESPPAVVETPPAAPRGDIRLEAPPVTPPARTRKAGREPAAAPASVPPAAQPRQ